MRGRKPWQQWEWVSRPVGCYGLSSTSSRLEEWCTNKHKLSARWSSKSGSWLKEDLKTPLKTGPKEQWQQRWDWLQKSCSASSPPPPTIPLTTRFCPSKLALNDAPQQSCSSGQALLLTADLAILLCKYTDEIKSREQRLIWLKAGVTYIIIKNFPFSHEAFFLSSTVPCWSFPELHRIIILILQIRRQGEFTRGYSSHLTLRNLNALSQSLWSSIRVKKVPARENSSHRLEITKFRRRCITLYYVYIAFHGC